METFILLHCHTYLNLSVLHSILVWSVVWRVGGFFVDFFFLKPRLKHLRSERDRVQRGRVKTRCCLKSCILAAIRIKKGYGKTTKRPPPPLLPPKSTDFVFHMRANKDVRNDGGVRHGKRGQPTEGLPNSSRKGAFTAIHDLYERTMK